MSQPIVYAIPIDADEVIKRMIQDLINLMHEPVKLVHFVTSKDVACQAGDSGARYKMALHKPVLSSLKTVILK